MGGSYLRKHAPFAIGVQHIEAKYLKHTLHAYGDIRGCASSSKNTYHNFSFSFIKLNVRPMISLMISYYKYKV